jgi:hypothetical protein
VFSVPFSAEEFFGVFTAYNHAVWPAQLLLIAAAIAAVGLAVGGRASAHRWIAAFLALLWGWTGAAYHLAHFAAINPAANAFGVLFLLQGALFLWWGGVRGRLEFGRPGGVRGLAAGAILVYALVVYPLLGGVAGQVYMAGPTFGAPCPAVIYTFGLLLLARSVPLWMLLIPASWAIVGSSAALAFGVYQDLGLLLGAAIAIGFLIRPPRGEADRPRPIPVRPGTAPPAGT